MKTVHREYGTIWLKGCWLNSQKVVVPTFRATSPLSRGRLKSKGHGKLSIHYAADLENDWNYFSHNCFCKPARSVRSSRRDMWRVWIPSWKNGETRCDGAIEFLTRAQCDQDRRTFGLWWPSKSRSSVAAIWRTKRKAVATRQNWVNFVLTQDFWMLLRTGTVFHDERHCRSLTISCSGLSWLHSSKRRTIITTKRTDPREHQNWSVLEVGTSYLSKYGAEIRIWSSNRDNTHSWVRISHGSNKFVMNLNSNETEIPEDQLEEYTLKLNAKDFACLSKAKAKPQRRQPAGSSPRTVPIGIGNWMDTEPEKYSFSDYEVSKKVTYLLRHSQHVNREEDGAVHFWRIKENLQSQFTLSTLVWRSVESMLGRRES